MLFRTLQLFLLAYFIAITSSTFKGWSKHYSKSAQKSTRKCGALAFAKDGKKMVCGGLNGKLQVWSNQLKSLLFQKQLDDHITVVKMHPIDQRVFVCTMSGSNYVFDLATGTLFARYFYPVAGRHANDLEFLLNQQKYVVVGGCDSRPQFYIYDIDFYTLVATVDALYPEDTQILEVAVSKKNGLIACSAITNKDNAPDILFYDAVKLKLVSFIKTLQECRTNRKVIQFEPYENKDLFYCLYEGKEFCQEFKQNGACSTQYQNPDSIDYQVYCEEEYDNNGTDENLLQNDDDDDLDIKNCTLQLECNSTTCNTSDCPEVDCEEEEDETCHQSSETGFYSLVRTFEASENLVDIDLTLGEVIALATQQGNVVFASIDDNGLVQVETIQASLENQILNIEISPNMEYLCVGFENEGFAVYKYGPLDCRQCCGCPGSFDCPGFNSSTCCGCQNNTDQCPLFDFNKSCCSCSNSTTECPFFDFNNKCCGCQNTSDQCPFYDFNTLCCNCANTTTQCPSFNFSASCCSCANNTDQCPFFDFNKSCCSCANTTLQCPFFDFTTACCSCANTTTQCPSFNFAFCPTPGNCSCANTTTQCPSFNFATCPTPGNCSCANTTTQCPSFNFATCPTPGNCSCANTTTQCPSFNFATCPGNCTCANTTAQCPSFNFTKFCCSCANTTTQCPNFNFNSSCCSCQNTTTQCPGFNFNSACCSCSNTTTQCPGFNFSACPCSCANTTSQCGGFDFVDSCCDCATFDAFSQNATVLQRLNSTCTSGANFTFNTQCAQTSSTFSAALGVAVATVFGGTVVTLIATGASQAAGAGGLLGGGGAGNVAAAGNAIPDVSLTNKMLL